MSFSFSDLEPVLNDNRVEKISGKIKLEFPDLYDAQFVTYLQPEQNLEGKGDGKVVSIPPVVVMALISPKPKSPGYSIMTKAAVYLDHWIDTEKKQKHFVGVEDPAYKIFRRTAKEHAKTMRNLREMN
jgi:hypothetical protein